MTILKYNILDPAIDKHKPYYDEKSKTFKFHSQQRYNYFLQAYQINPTNNLKEYLLLLGKDKFDEGCRKCNTNQYGQCSVKLTGEFEKYVVTECKERGNIEVEYLSTEEGYNVYLVH